MGAHQLAPGEPYSALQADRLERLWTGALAARSQAFVKLTNRFRSAQYPIWSPESVQDAPAGRILPSELGSPRRRKSGGQSTPTFWHEARVGQG